MYCFFVIIPVQPTYMFNWTPNVTVILYYVFSLVIPCFTSQSSELGVTLQSVYIKLKMSAREPSCSRRFDREIALSPCRPNRNVLQSLWVWTWALSPRKAEQTGKPTYQSYSSKPIEQESGPRAAQSEAIRRDRTEGTRRGLLGKREKRSTQVRCRAQDITTWSLGFKKRNVREPELERSWKWDEPHVFSNSFKKLQWMLDQIWFKPSSSTGWNCWWIYTNSRYCTFAPSLFFPVAWA